MSQETPDANDETGEPNGANDSGDPIPTQADVVIDTEAWSALTNRVQEYTQRGTDPLAAWEQSVEEIVMTTPNVVVDGEVRGVEDVDAVESTEADADADSDPDSDDQDGATPPRADAHLAVGLLADVRQGSFRGSDVLEAVGHIDSALDITTDADARRQLERARAALNGILDVDGEERDEQLANALTELAPVAAGVAGRESSLDPTYRDQFPQPPGGEVPSLLKNALTAHPDEQAYYIRQAWREFARAYDGVEGPPDDIYNTTAPRSGVDGEREVVDPEAHEDTSATDRPTVPVFYSVPAAAVDRAIERFQHRVENPFGDDSPYQAQVVRLRDFIYSEIEEAPVIWVDGVPLSRYVADAGAELRVERPSSEER
jgi:hypothetical protein